MGSQMRLKASRTSAPTMLRQPIRHPPRFMVTREIGTVITINRRVSVKMVKLIHMLHGILSNTTTTGALRAMTFVLDGPTYQHDAGKEKQSGGGAASGLALFLRGMAIVYGSGMGKSIIWALDLGVRISGVAIHLFPGTALWRR